MPSRKWCALVQEIKDASSNLQVAHHNQLFLLATPQGEVMPMNKNEDVNSSVSTQSALAELTLMEYEKDLPKDLKERCQTHHHLASCVLLGWWMAYCDHFLWWPTGQH